MPGKKGGIGPLQGKDKNITYVVPKMIMGK